jgi:pyruvate carboxylase
MFFNQVRAVAVEDKSAAVETISREKATADPGSVGAPMSGVVVEVRVKEGTEVKRGDIISILSAMKVCTSYICMSSLEET